MLSVIIPTLNAENGLAATLAALARARDHRLVGEVIVADGGSRDGTGEIARAHGAMVIEGARGRGAQLRAGARAACGDWLLFLHADTVPGPGWEAAVAGFIEGPTNQECAGVFRFALDDESRRARWLVRAVNWRTRVLGLPYGDQGLLIARRLYGEIGGFRPMPIMEDVDLVRRLGRARIKVLEADAVTSAARYVRAGYARRVLRNLSCLGLYYLHVPPRVLLRLYQGRS